VEHANENTIESIDEHIQGVKGESSMRKSTEKHIENEDVRRIINGEPKIEKD
jgi:hypothetical protein